MRRKNSPPTKSPSTWPGSALLLIAILYVQCKPGSGPEGTGAAPWLWREASVASYVRKSYNAKDNIMPAAASCSAIKELCPSGESTVPCLEQGKKRHAEGGPKSFRLRKPGHFHVGWCLMAVTSSGLWVGSHVLTFLDADAAGGRRLLTITPGPAASPARQLSSYLLSH